MAYPKRCEGCEQSYAQLPGMGMSAHVTLASEDGGTPSPWLAERAGRILDLGCGLCGAIFRWDYFGRAADGSLGVERGLVRGPQRGWQPERGFRPETEYGSTYASHRRAS
jgi:hypothetical protein